MPALRILLGTVILVSRNLGGVEGGASDHPGSAVDDQAVPATDDVPDPIATLLVERPAGDRTFGRCLQSSCLEAGHRLGRPDRPVVDDGHCDVAIQEFRGDAIHPGGSETHWSISRVQSP